MVDSHSPSGKNSFFFWRISQNWCWTAEVLNHGPAMSSSFPPATKIFLFESKPCGQRMTLKNQLKSSWLQINHALGDSWFFETSYSRCCFNPPLWMLSVFSNRLAHVGFCLLRLACLGDFASSPLGVMTPQTCIYACTTVGATITIPLCHLL